MITQKKMIIPIFDYKLTVLIYDSWSEVRDYFDDDEEPRGITKSWYGASLVAVNSKYAASIVHEAEHVKNEMWNYIGYRPQADNDEVDAYVITYLYNKMADVYYKHLGKKDFLTRDTH